jgi:hypothetical protein
MYVTVTVLRHMCSDGDAGRIGSEHVILVVEALSAVPLVARVDVQIVLAGSHSTENLAIIVAYGTHDVIVHHIRFHGPHALTH